MRITISSRSMKSFILFCGCLLALKSSAQMHPGNVTGFTRERNGVTVRADSSTIRLVWYAPDILRIDLLPSPHSAADTSFVVVQKPADNLYFLVDDSDSVLSVSSSRMRVRCRKHPLQLSISDSAGRLLLAEPSTGGFSWDGKLRTTRFALHHNDHFYGTGERGTSLDKRGQRFVSYNTQVGGYTGPVATMNLNVPFLASTNGYALYIDNIWKGEFDLGASDTSTFSYTAAGGELAVYVVAAPSIPDQLGRYTWLTGRQPLPPRWAFGFIQSKNRYENEQEALGIARTMREKRIPCDAIVLDLKWFASMGDISWNEASWPRHEAMISDFLRRGMKTILITEPYLVQGSRNFHEADAMGFLARDSSGHSFLMNRWWSCGDTCGAALLDLTNPDAREWWWREHPPAFGTRVAGIWTDLGEPERHPEGMVHYLGPAEKIHNIYNLLWAQTIFDGFTRLRPNERVVNLTRSGFAGIQRYGVIPWSGDVARSFGGLQVQLPMMLNMGMSGLGYHNSDIGGYSRIPTTPELYVRWMQYGTFCPVARAHGAGETVRGSATEPWQFGTEAERICREYIQLRYRLLPYIYTLAHHNCESGMPLARPLFWLDPEDPALLNESSSYMWGDAFLVSPVVHAGDTTKDILLPRGTWVNFWTDEVLQGGRTVSARAPLERMPLFVRQGSIIPMAPVMEYTDERPLDTLTVRVYPTPDREISYTLYEDDGKTLEYQHGRFALTTFTVRSAGKKGTSGLTVTVGPSRGMYAGKPGKRVYIFEVHNIPRRPSAVRFNGVRLPQYASLELLSMKREGYYYDTTTKQLFSLATCQTDRSYKIAVFH